MGIVGRGRFPFTVIIIVYSIEILLHLFDNKNITRREAIILLNLGKTKVKELFKALLEKELLERKGQGRSTHYVVSKKEDKG